MPRPSDINPSLRNTPPTPSKNSDRLKRKEHALNFLRSSIVPALSQIGVQNRDMAALLLATAIHESKLLHRNQIGGGPALGYFQIEIATHDDIWENYLNYRDELARKVSSLLPSVSANKITELQFNDRYGAVMAYLKYHRSGNSIPSRSNIRAMAQLWKNVYNTSLGRGTVDGFIDSWKSVFGDATLP